MERTYRVGTRPSPLALRQVGEVLTSLKGFYPEVITIDTYGDKDKNTPISETEGSDFFTREIDEAILRGEIDLAVHSAKDLPNILAPGLFLAAITKSIDLFDVLVSKDNLRLNELKIGTKIGTSSLRRKNGLRNYRKDFKIVDIRGNIEERLKQLDETDLDAIVIAAAGLMRLGLEQRITQRIPFEIIEPHPMQGRLAIVVREDNEDIIRMCREGRK